MNASPGSGEVAQPQLDRVDAEDAGGLVEVRLDRPDLLRVAEAPERGRRHGVRQDAPGDGSGRPGTAYGPFDVKLPFPTVRSAMSA